MLGAQRVVEALARRGVTTIFSLSGNQIMPLYDACIDARIRIVHVRHEAAAVYMADGWSQVTGEIGVAMLTAGPGLANGLAPLFCARQAESPVLLISGDSPLAEDGLGAFQEMDQAGLTRPLTKRSTRVTSPAALARTIDEAIDHALAPRRGPVHLALPFDLLTARHDSATGATASDPAPGGDTEAIAAARTLGDLIARSRRPLALLGPTQCRASQISRWRDWGASWHLPVLAMESPRGLRDPSLGAVAARIAQADLIVLAGKRLDFSLRFGRAPAFAADARVVAIDPDPAMLERAARASGERLTLSVQADPEALLRAMPSHAGTVPDASRAQWLRTVEAARADRTMETASPADGTNATAPTPAPTPASTPASIPPPATALDSRMLCEAVQRFIATLDEPILICDGGEFGQWAQAFCTAPVRVINGMSGAIGGGIGYAIAARLARPSATVVLLMGDGTAGFHLTEFDTAVRERAPFVAVIGNDLRWNAEHVIQLNTYGPDRLIGCQLSASAAYHDAVSALGGHGIEVREAGALQAALREAAASGLPACVNVPIEGRPAPDFGGARANAPGH